MVGFLERARRPQAVAVTIVAVCALLAAYALVQMAGTKTGTAIALLTTVGPAAIYAALVAPVTFPFSFYLALTPFDNILDIGQFGTLTRLLGILSGAALLFFMLSSKRFREPPRATALWLLLFLWMASSIFWALDVTTAEGLLLISLQLFGLYLVTSMLTLSLPQLRIAAFGAAAGGVASALYGLWMYASGEGMFKQRLFVHTDTSSINPDHFGASLLLPIAICLIALLWSRSMLLRAGSLIGLCAMIATVALTGSRGAELGLAFMLAYLIWRDRHRVWIACASVFAAIIVMAVAGPTSLARWSMAAQTGGAGRASIWSTGLEAFKENWLFGAGYGSFPFAYDHAFISTFQPDNAHWHRASHNIFLGAGVELGIIGLALLLLAWWGQFRLLAHIPETDPRFPLRLALEGALVGLFVCGLFADIMIEKYLWLAFMLVVLTHNTVRDGIYARTATQISVEGPSRSSAVSASSGA